MIFALVCVINALQRIALAKISFEWWANACPHASGVPGVEIKRLMAAKYAVFEGLQGAGSLPVKMAKIGILGRQAKVMVRG